jgi:hypothetical protein
VGSVLGGPLQGANSHEHEIYRSDRVHASRSHLWLPWLTFEFAMRLCGTGSSGGAAYTVERTNKGRVPLLPIGGQIMAGHSLWAIDVEPGAFAENPPPPAEAGEFL